MKVYKLRHKPTGLFYKPYHQGVGGNLSPIGKLYEKKPSLAWVDKIRIKLSSGSKQEWASKIREVFFLGSGHFNFVTKTKLTDWEYVEYSLVEKNMF